ncbi:hypothetical protein SteCoe_32284 [Stentor coeruleus]|uniref:Uncharacterized protein n=1 Tax=Stentor coeruleus TaxID=5963 RepID=A0A1R2AZC4_9CILI|nr:hypothetical protein SteCoe_32284 [Stentor coeruleus]
MIGSLASSKWVKSDFYICSLDFENEISYSNSCEKFEGGLLLCKEGCYDTYENEYKTLCDEDSNTSSTLYGKIQLSFCNMFIRLYYGGLAMIGFEIISFISIIIWFSTMICSYRIKKCFWATCCCSICSCISHFIGIIVWFALSKADFKNECNIFPLDGSQPNLCATDGPGLSIFLMIIFPIIVGFYLFIGFKAYRINECPNIQNVETDQNENINLVRRKCQPQQTNNYVEEQQKKEKAKSEIVGASENSNGNIQSATFTKGVNKKK